MFAAPRVNLRLRCSPAGGELRCAAWTATFTGGFATLAEAAAAVGLWPRVSPDEDAASVRVPLIRRPLENPESPVVHSFTAAIRDGLITSVSAFDEAPDWA